MSDDDRIRLMTEIVVSAGAAGRCPNHYDAMLDLHLADDLLAQRQQEAWEQVVTRTRADGFSGDIDLELQPDFIFVLQSVDQACPTCRTVLDPPDRPEDRRPQHPWLSDDAE